MAKATNRYSFNLDKFLFDPKLLLRIATPEALLPESHDIDREAELHIRRYEGDLRNE